MTIGIAAFGPGAGESVTAALASAERTGRGEIGGFCVLAGLTADGALVRFAVQRGGLAAVLASAAAAGQAEAMLAAPVAALISSGPDRPEPLAQFLAGAAGIGLVTGHRLPNARTAAGQPVNLAALDLLGTGASPERAVEEPLAGNPELDAGLIAVTASGIHAANSARVGRRSDIGAALWRAADGTAGAALLHNSIEPVEGLAGLALGETKRVLSAGRERTFAIVLRCGVEIVAAERDIVTVDGEGRVLRIESASPTLPILDGWTRTAVYPGSIVIRDGREVGRTIGDCPARVTGGRIVALRTETKVLAEFV